MSRRVLCRRGDWASAYHHGGEAYSYKEISHRGGGRSHLVRVSSAASVEELETSIDTKMSSFTESTERVSWMMTGASKPVYCH